MSQAYLGSFNGTVTPNVNMLDIFKKKELEDNPHSVLQYGKLVLKKFGISAPAGTIVEINGKEIPLFTGVFELGLNQIDISSLVFNEAVDVSIYYMY